MFTMALVLFGMMSQTFLGCPDTQIFKVAAALQGDRG